MYSLIVALLGFEKTTALKSTNSFIFYCSWEEDKPDINPINSTTFVYNPYVSLSLERQRQRLPIAKNRDHILYLLEKYQTLVLVGETGCGKSTQVPQVATASVMSWNKNSRLNDVT
jgi:ATP-dependent RNA helicase DDX35